MKTRHGFPDDAPTMLAHIDEIGGPHFENRYPIEWCWARSSPLKWMKQVASHFGQRRTAIAVPPHIGYTFFMKDGKLHWEHNWFNESRHRVSSKTRIPLGKRVLSAEIKVDKENQFLVFGRKVFLRVREQLIGEGRFEKQGVPFHSTGGV